MSPDLHIAATHCHGRLPTLTVLISLLLSNQRLADLQTNMHRRFDEHR